ncbi:liprin-beta-2 isoform X3 [Nilaparvata lugens]|uniref:liprin-beta-2 isoform X3 n=1 Tax=Nilaparvata lugens TaxID=108931 RepID=UPI00193CEC7F|nr:liprin-beta-2 isoform X3 [Nilaparvata lugens]
MMRGGSGPVVAAAVAMLEQHQGGGLRRVGGVNVLPRASAAPGARTPGGRQCSRDTSSSPSSSEATSSDDDKRTDSKVEDEVGEDVGSEPERQRKKMEFWTQPRREEGVSFSSDSSSCSGSDQGNVKDEHNTTECDEDFQWVKNCPKTGGGPHENTNADEDSSSSYVLKEFEDIYNKCTATANQKPEEPKVVYRRPASNSLDRNHRHSYRKDRDGKSKSQQNHAPEHPRYPPSCLPSCPPGGGYDFHRHYGSTPRLDCYQHTVCCHFPYSLPPPTAALCPYDQSSYPLRYFNKTPAEADEQLRRLEGDKQSLSLQVTVLNDQIEAQSEKISDLEKTLEEQKKQITNAENLLQREVLTRSSLETQKLELLAVVTELKRQQACLERENVDLRERLGDERRRQKPPPAPPRVSPFASTPNNRTQDGHNYNSSPTPSPILQNNVRKLSEDSSSPILHQTGFQTRLGNPQYSSLPRQHHLQAAATADQPTATALKNRVAFGRNQHLYLLSHSGDRCSSVPNLAESETVVISDTASEADVSNANGNYSQNSTPSLQMNKARGIKKIFTRIKRSGSGSLDDIVGDGEFRRGGVRATANARLGWTTNQTTRSDQPFSEWNTDALCAWLTDLGLDYCATEAKRWIKSGTQLLNATQSEVDKELAIKNPLHRKKLHLALYCERGGGNVTDSTLVAAGALGTGWVLRWLDDVGLPQHKDAFLAARVDGRLLHRLTLDDLAALHVTNALHVASVRTGIQVLRNNNFDGNCLIRRSAPDSSENVGPAEIALWTNHRVMEWLRAVDLAEYAPNLRGSGVHGGLLVHEPRFTGELLASLLSIPPGKTLLRRHLTTHFKDLLGRDVIQEKRDAEAQLGYVPLTTTAKVKVAKKSQFTLKRKKSKGELDYGELVCPLDGCRETMQESTSSKSRGCLS